MYNAAAMTHTDVLIVGAGPAGLATALHLVRLDPTWAERLVVLEKRTHPRTKVCGGGITRFGLTQLHRLNLRLGVPFVAANQAILEYRGQRVRVRGQPVVAVVNRREFDAWLAGEARARGVRMLEDHPVERIERLGDRLQVETPQGSLNTRALIGADGSASLVRRWAFGPTAGHNQARLLETVCSPRDTEPVFTERVVRFLFDDLRRALQGYFWEFPSLVAGQPRLNAGVYDARIDPWRGRPRLPQLLEDRLGDDPQQIEAAGLQSAPLHLFTPFARFSAPRVLLVGDAAGADPLFGEGIGVAMGYAAVAAETLADGFADSGLSFRSYRRRILFSPVGRYLMFRYLLAQGCYAHSGSDRFVRAFWLLMDTVARAIGELPPIPDVLPAAPQTDARSDRQAA
jgi:flavin-dependent dehydrogenase